jgi:hypothetical protein
MARAPLIRFWTFQPRKKQKAPGVATRGSHYGIAGDS